MALENIGRYNITGELGRGAMGVVYKAIDPNIGRTVAIKTTRLDIQGPDSPDLLRRFKNEARSAGTLNHPNIVTIYDAGEQDGVFYIAMEYIEGETLQALLNQRRALPVETIVDIVRHVCSALDYAHAHRVIHRDIKPANIMLAGDGAVKVMDFGIAKAGGSMTATGTVLGTPNYMSPEQVRGRDIDGRSDLFSLGVVLYEMLTGEKPFDGQNVTTIIYKIVSENPIPPRELDATIHPGLSSVVTKALAKVPDERYQTGAELVADLEHYSAIRSVADDEASALRSAAATRTPTRSVGIDSDGVATAAVTTRVYAPAAAAPKLAAESAATAKTAPKKSSPQLLAAVLVILVIGGITAWRVHRHKQQLQPPSSAEIAAQSPSPAPSAPVASAPGTETPATTQSSPEAPAAEVAATQAAGPRAPTKSKPKAAVLQPAPPAAPAAPEAPSAGTVHVTSTPPGATVAIDGSGSYLTPFDTPPLSAGSHSFAFSKLGTAAVQRKFEVAAGKTTTLDVSLAASGGVLDVQSDPAGAAILVDERPTNKFTPAKLAIPQGEHKLRLRLAGYKDENTVLTLTEGQTVSYSPKLVPAKASKLKRLFGGGGSSEDMGIVEVATHPDGAHVTFNGAAAAQTTPLKIAVKPGKYELAIILPGYKSLHRTVEIEKGKTLGLDEVLEKEKP